MKIERIEKHVLHFERGPRIELLAALLSQEARFRKLEREYPVEITMHGIRAVMVVGDSDGFSFDGWVNALWGSL